MSLLKDFEELCKYVRECTGDDIVCGFCEYDAGTVGEEPMECPGFESNECFVLKESLRKQYELYEQVIRCKDCKYCSVDRHADGNVPDYVCIEMDCGVETDGFCSWAERREE